MPIISIIIANLNAAKTLERCLKSIIKQRLIDFELIIIDGGSTDASVEIINLYNNQIDYWESKPDKGIYHAWNKALTHAKGKWICFIGADDFLWNKNVLSDLSPYLDEAEQRNIRIVYGKMAEVTADNETLKYVGKAWSKIKWQLQHGMPRHLPHPGLMHHSSLFKEYGFFDENFRIAGDYEFLLRELKNGSALFAESIIVTGHQTGGIADELKLSTQIEVIKAKWKNGYRSFSWLWTIVFIRTLSRTIWRKLNLSEILRNV